MLRKVPTTDQHLDYALRNLEGCIGKLRDAISDDAPWMDYERAVYDSIGPLQVYVAQLRKLQGELRDLAILSPGYLEAT